MAEGSLNWLTYLIAHNSMHHNCLVVKESNVAIATLANDPEILISVNHFGTGSQDNESNFGLAQAQPEFGLTIVLITHEIRPSKKSPIKVAVMQNGEIIGQ